MEISKPFGIHPGFLIKRFSAQPDHYAGQNTKIRGLTFTQRNNLHGAIKEILIRIRTKGKWKKIGLYTLKAKHFQEIDFPQPENVEAFSIDILSNHTENDPKIATLAEIGAY